MIIFHIIMGVFSIGQMVTGWRTIRSGKFAFSYKEGEFLFETTNRAQLDGQAALLVGRSLFITGIVIMLLWLVTMISRMINPNLISMLTIFLTALIQSLTLSKARDIQNRDNQ